MRRVARPHGDRAPLHDGDRRPEAVTEPAIEPSGRDRRAQSRGRHGSIELGIARLPLTPGESPSAPLPSITASTVVIHGTADPMFPIEHGQAVAHEIPNARLFRLDGAGHGIDPADRERIAAVIIDHTAAADLAG
jgi:pimeloyl-ACP methyl ester carboxylesterase